MHPAIDKGALALAEAIRGRALLPSEALHEVISRIQARNPSLNALVSSCFETAQHRADLADVHLRGLSQEALDALPPLFGVPFVVSESLALAGLPHSSGSRFRSDRIAGEDATAVTRLVEAGAIPVGVANTAELGFWIETQNLVYGRTASPWDPSRIAGGASGGVAALVATRCVPFGLGVDMCGSLRIAGHACGVFTHKPSGGLVPVTGFEPLPDGRMRRYTGIGPIARSTDDLSAILGIIAGPDPRDPMSLNQPELPIERWDPVWRRVVVIRDFGIPGLNVSDENAKQLELATSILEAKGAVIEYWQPRELRDAFWIWLALVHEGYGLSWNFSDRIVPGQRGAWLKELLRAPLGRSRVSLPVAMMAITEAITKESFLRIQRNSAAGRRLRDRIQALLQDDGILLLPVLPGAPPKHRRTLTQPHLVAWTGLFNTLELPVTTVPMMGSRSKYPVGIQVVAREHRDDLALSAAQTIAAGAPKVSAPGERRTSFFRRP